jgi:hypothetical protein
MAFRRLVTSPPKVPRPPRRRVRTATSPDPPGSSRWAVKGRQTPVSRVYLLVSLTGPAPSGSTGTPRRCQGCSHPHRRLPDQAALSFTPPLRRQGVEGLSPPLDSKRLVAHVTFRPVVADEQHCGLRSATGRCQQPAEDSSALMDQCSRHDRAGTTPHQPFISRPQAGARSNPRTQHRSRRRECSPTRGYQAPSLPAADPAAPIRWWRCRLSSRWPSGGRGPCIGRPASGPAAGSPRRRCRVPRRGSAPAGRTG